MAQLSILDLFTIGIGPSSSHTVGPMRAANAFMKELSASGNASKVTGINVQCFGSLAATGKGHGTDKAIILGLAGEDPETVDIDSIEHLIKTITQTKSILLPCGKTLAFDPNKDLDLTQTIALPLHPNGMLFTAFNASLESIYEQVYYSTGGGFIVTEKEFQNPAPAKITKEIPYIYNNAAELIALCDEHNLSISQIARANELCFHADIEIKLRLHAVWQAMEKCVKRGISKQGALPGGLNVSRRAKTMYKSLIQRGEALLRDPLAILDWVNLYALAVNEENAAGGRVVTAPTNGAAGIIPAVLHYATRFCHSPYQDAIERFLLTAGAIALLYKKNASISGADVGCQGEVGVACSMAAGALTEFLGGTPHQVENAAEIGMEHNLGLTCDPIGGLVQIPCIERNAMGAVKAINAARMAMTGNGQHYVALDKVMITMLATGRDMQSKYKETALGGLAVNVVEC